MGDLKECTAEKVLGMRIINGVWEYQIKWKGYPNSFNTWETEVNCNCQEAIVAFIESIPKLPLSNQSPKNQETSKSQSVGNATISPVYFVNNRKGDGKSQTPEAKKNKIPRKVISSDCEMEQELSSQECHPSPSRVPEMNAKMKKSRRSTPIKDHSVNKENQDEKSETLELKKMRMNKKQTPVEKKKRWRNLRSHSLEPTSSLVNAQPNTETSKARKDKMRRMSAPARELVTRSKSRAENQVDTKTEDISYENEILQSPAPKKNEKFKKNSKTQVQAEKELSPGKPLLIKDTSQGDRRKLTTSRRTSILTPSKRVKAQVRRGRPSVEHETSAQGGNSSDDKMVQSPKKRRRSDRSTPFKRNGAQQSGGFPSTSEGFGGNWPETPKGDSVLTPGNAKKRQSIFQRSEFKCMGVAGFQIQQEVLRIPRKRPRRPRLNLHLTPGSKYVEVSSSSDPAVEPLEDSDEIEEGIRTPKETEPTSMSTPVKSTENQVELRYYSLRSQAGQSPGIHGKSNEKRDSLSNERAEILLKPRHPIKRLREKILRDNIEDAEQDREQISPPKSKRLKVSNDSSRSRRRDNPDNRVEESDSSDTGKLCSPKVRRSAEVQSKSTSAKANVSVETGAKMTPNKETKNQRKSTKSAKKRMSENITEENAPNIPQSTLKSPLVMFREINESQISMPKTPKEETRSFINRKKATVQVEFKSPENCRVDPVNQNAIPDFDRILKKPVPKGTVMTAKSRFDLGMKVDKIAGSTVVDGEIVFLVTWIGTSEAEIVPAKVANKKCPQEVIKYYESLWNWRKEKNMRN
ncbi:unnamed protein product [Hymenolepis diminuta]|uniref:Chromo domain-containing protein n=1 Tax=Hymenolepis diminuta TaxID=6216 RepID=A0A564YBX6_HYMDI|nr:unnamed protein product [Hymenolepis diminuta]